MTDEPTDNRRRENIEAARKRQLSGERKPAHVVRVCDALDKGREVIRAAAPQPRPDYWSAAKQEQARISADPMRHFRKPSEPEQDRDR